MALDRRQWRAQVVGHRTQHVVAHAHGGFGGLRALALALQLILRAIAYDAEAPLRGNAPMPAPVARADAECILPWAQVGVAREAVRLWLRPGALQAHELRAIQHPRRGDEGDGAVVD